MVSQITSTSTAAFFTLTSQKTSRFISGFPSWRTSNAEFRLSKMSVWKRGSPSQWGHNGRDGVSNQGSLDCLLSRLFRRWSKNTPKPHVTGLCDGNPLLTGGFPPQRTNNAENVSSWRRRHARCLSWRHHDTWMLFFSCRTGPRRMAPIKLHKRHLTSKRGFAVLCWNLLTSRRLKIRTTSRKGKYHTGFSKFLSNQVGNTHDIWNHRGGVTHISASKIGHDSRKRRRPAPNRYLNQCWCIGTNGNEIGIMIQLFVDHDDVIKWKHFPRYWPFVRGIHRSTVNCPHKGPWRGALMLSLICVWINGWVNNREAGDLRRYRTHYDVTVMEINM